MPSTFHPGRRRDDAPCERARTGRREALRSEADADAQRPEVRVAAVGEHGVEAPLDERREAAERELDSEAAAHAEVRLGAGDLEDRPFAVDVEPVDVPRGDVDLDPSGPTDEATNRFPQRISQAELPAADRISHRIDSEHNGAIAAKVRLCVTPEGKVGAVDLLDSSGMAAYDEAVVASIQSWEYASYPAPSDTRVCEKVTVTYRTP